MSAKPIALEDGLAQLRADRYAVEVHHQHLMVHNVPYVNAQRTVNRGTIICTYVESGGRLMPPDNHQVWFTGDFPCFPDGKPMEALRNEDGERELFPACTIRHRFSNKPAGVSQFNDHYNKVVHYISLLSDQAQAIDRLADARNGQVIEMDEGESVFKYADSASARSEILAVSERLALQKVAIVGLGGTGSYVLDQVAKTPVRELHLFDGDKFEQHNAFRAPGAASIEELEASLHKTEYFKRKYEPMRRGLISHPVYLDQSTVGELADFDFVFVCVDSGPSRALICKFLQSKGRPFIDVGMSVDLVLESNKLIGVCRFTLATAAQNDHIDKYLPVVEDTGDALYRRNIQVADMNAMNAVLAVMKWKQVFGFYHDDFQPHQGTFSVATQSLTRDVMTSVVQQE